MIRVDCPAESVPRRARLDDRTLLSERIAVTESPAQNVQPAGPGAGGPGGGPRRRKPPRRVTVTSVSKIGPRLVSVLVTGDELDGFTDAAPTSHLKLFLPPAGADQ